MIDGRPRILIVKLSAIGDVVHTLPALNALRGHYPNASITWLVEQAAAPMVIGHQALDRVLISKRKTWLSGLKTGLWRIHLKQMRAFVHQLRDTHYDLIIDFQGALKGAALIALARGKIKIGFDRGMAHQECSHLVLNRRIAPISMEVHALDRYLQLLAPLGIDPPPVTYQIPITKAAEQSVQRILVTHGGKPDSLRVAINPMAQWKTKLWPNRHFSELADRLVEGYNAHIFFTGSAEDRQIIDEIRSQMHHPAINLAGLTTLPELAALFKQMTCLISTDTGPMHIASAVATPVVAIFGPTSPQRTGPYGRNHRIVQTDLACVPCFKRRCSTTECMAAIDADQVMSAVQALLAKSTNDQDPVQTDVEP